MKRPFRSTMDGLDWFKGFDMKPSDRRRAQPEGFEDLFLESAWEMFDAEMRCGDPYCDECGWK